MRKLSILILLVLLGAVAFGAIHAHEENDPYLVASLQAANIQLASMNAPIRAAQIDAFTFGSGRVRSGRILQQEFRWVPGDPNRLPDGNDLTYMIVPDGTASGLSASDTTTAIRSALETWDAQRCSSGLNLNERPFTGGDVTIYDAFVPGPWTDGFGNYLAADIVNAGWYPGAYFEAAGGPGGGRGILAFSVTFTWTDAAGNPADFNNDGYIDVALNEVYYNDTFGDPQSEFGRAGNPWGINIALPGIDVQTVALHENGHSLNLGHFAPPPDAVMNPIYAGIRQQPTTTDNGGHCAVFGSWPNR